MNRDEFDLRTAFGETPAKCSDAVTRVLRSICEEAPARRKVPATLVLAAILILMMTIAVAVEGWSVLDFLGLRRDGGAGGMAAPVTASARSGSCTVSIDSALSDGVLLAFDWTVQNHDPAQPVYMQVERFTVNGLPASIDGTDDFHCQWFPGWCNEGVMQDGELVPLPEGAGSEKLQVELVIGLYMPEKPVYHMPVFNAAEALRMQEAGYYVIAEGDGFVLRDPEMEAGLLHGFGMVNSRTGEGLLRSEMSVTFEVPVAGEPLQDLLLPQPVPGAGMTLQYVRAFRTTLQTTLELALLPEDGSYASACRIWEMGWVEATDPMGQWLDVRVLSGEGDVRQRADGSWIAYWRVNLVNEPQLPQELALTWRGDDGSQCIAPIQIR